MPRLPTAATVAALALQVGRCRGKAALLVIDVQDCFLESLTTSGQPGSLSVPASQIIAPINQIRSERSCLFDLVVRTQDFHPAGHISFASTHGLAPFAHLDGKGSLPLTCISPDSGKTEDGACCPTIYVNASAVDCETQLCPPTDWDYALNNSGFVDNNPACAQCVSDPASCFTTDQAMWTDHCLQDGDSTFPPSLATEASDIVIQKGMNEYVDAYSAFMDNTKTLKTTLDSALQAEGIDTIYVAGIATDVCVRWTVEDALAGNYVVKVISDATAAVLGDQANFDDAVTAMVGAGAQNLTVADVLAMECPTEDTTEMPSGGVHVDTTETPSEMPVAANTTEMPSNFDAAVSWSHRRAEASVLQGALLACVALLGGTLFAQFQ
jgi:nicotinamidase-related amidase